MKGQQQAVSAILISGILIGVVGSVYFWGVPLIQKNQDVTTLTTAEEFMKNLDEKIRFIANNGGRDAVLIPDGGIAAFSGGEITYTIITDGTIYATGVPVPLGRHNECLINDGEFGKIPPGILCITSAQLNEDYENAYSLKYITLYTENEGGLKTSEFLINLEGDDAVGSGGDSIIIENLDVQKQGIAVTADVGIRIFSV